VARCRHECFAKFHRHAEAPGWHSTPPSRNSNLELIHYIRDYLDEYGVRSTPGAERGGHQGQPVRLDRAGRRGRHRGCRAITDVVPVDGQAWTTDPWELTAKDDGQALRAVAPAT